MTPQELEQVAVELRSAEKAISDLVAEAGVGGHFNEEQSERAVLLSVKHIKGICDKLDSLVDSTVLRRAAQSLEEAPAAGTEAALLAGDASIPALDNPPVAQVAPIAQEPVVEAVSVSASDVAEVPASDLIAGAVGVESSNPSDGGSPSGQ